MQIQIQLLPSGPEHEPYTDPQTGYEYDSRKAFYEGKDPSPHWRNAQIRKIRATLADAYIQYKVSRIIALYDRQGTPLCPECAFHHPHAFPSTEYQRTLDFTLQNAENP